MFRRKWSASLVLSFTVAACGGSPAAPPAEPVAAGPVAAKPASASPARANAAPKPAAEREPESVVAFSLEPLAAGVRPGGKVTLAAHFRIAPGYRISWKAAGDVGSPTTVTFRAPPGFEVGPPQFPAPERYTVPGGYGGIGYEHETVVFVEVKAPANLRSDAVSRFDVDAGWVACKSTCATERTSAFVELTTTYGDARIRDVEAAVAPFRARLPKSLRDSKDAEATWEFSPQAVSLVVKLPGATVRDFVSDATADPKPEKTSLGDGELRFAYDEAPRPGSKPLRGVIVARIDGKDAFFDLEAPLPGDREPAATPKAPPRKKKRR